VFVDFRESCPYGREEEAEIHNTAKKVLQWAISPPMVVE
jgi:hypothetical protein